MVKTGKEEEKDEWRRQGWMRKHTPAGIEFRQPDDQREISKAGKGGDEQRVFIQTCNTYLTEHVHSIQQGGRQLAVWYFGMQQ